MCDGPVDILLVDDQASDAELALHALRGLESVRRVHVVRNGADALDFLFARGVFANRKDEPAPRLILLDLKLPRVSGIEVLDVLKSDPQTRNIPVIALTSSCEACDVERCYDLGVNSYVVKPVDFSAFTETVQRIAQYWLTTNEAPVC
ncbi:two-component system response regulator [Longibacter salinarum]|uniref:Two-component system response regulator n=1 Tax=Longibacter salinarum TaxID=1850348 RepID=A0A2A8CVN2_9BACT|nr:response regulator [Longibacter salinarum]PEN12661.1 two-component system response regulator [Longibacter salinarum]